MRKYLDHIYFYQSPSSLAETLYDDNQIRNDTIAKYGNDTFIDLRNFINRKKITKNENPKKIYCYINVNSIGKILNFKSQQN